MMPPSLPVCFPLLPPSTTNRSIWKNWLTTVCLCKANVSSPPEQLKRNALCPRSTAWMLLIKHRVCVISIPAY
ncbi:unnamed protein product [Periconia digitata]|uniref:Uncharacterized protein n=1 Tax=Periconia digitata TaxID=1303443 RepID=A0A9W4UJF7_9PLEO|nr:unnamed protein product [Periconia digitata]